MYPFTLHLSKDTKQPNSIDYYTPNTQNHSAIELSVSFTQYLFLLGRLCSHILFLYAMRS